MSCRGTGWGSVTIDASGKQTFARDAGCPRCHGAGIITMRCPGPGTNDVPPSDGEDIEKLIGELKEAAVSAALTNARLPQEQRREKWGRVDAAEQALLAALSHAHQLRIAAEQEREQARELCTRRGDRILEMRTENETLLRERDAAEERASRAEQERDRLRAEREMVADDLTSWLSTDADDGATIRLMVNCNDVFSFASADCEEVPDDQFWTVHGLWKRFGWAGALAWAIRQRGQEPFKPYDEPFRSQLAKARNALAAHSTPTPETPTFSDADLPHQHLNVRKGKDL